MKRRNVQLRCNTDDGSLPLCPPALERHCWWRAWVSACFSDSLRPKNTVEVDERKYVFTSKEMTSLNFLKKKKKRTIEQFPQPYHGKEFFRIGEVVLLSLGKMSQGCYIIHLTQWRKYQVLFPALTSDQLLRLNIKPLEDRFSNISSSSKYRLKFSLLNACVTETIFLSPIFFYIFFCRVLVLSYI